MRRHELTDEEWATLEPLLPPSRPATGRPKKTIARSSTVSSGSCVQVLPGGTCPSAMDLGALSTAASVAGSKQVCGIAYLERSRAKLLTMTGLTGRSR